MTNFTKVLLSSTAILLLASAAQAEPIGANELEAALTGLAQTQGPDYAQARDALLEREGAQTALEARQASWTAQSWRADAMAAVVLGRLTHGETFAAVADLRGVRASYYLLKRSPAPNVYRDLRPQAARLAPAILEVLLKTRGTYAFADDFPAHVTAAQQAELKTKERLALHEGLLLALGDSGHPAAPFVLAAELNDVTQGVAVRSAAAVGLGSTGLPGALNDLARHARSADADSSLRAACLSGAALVPTNEALDLLIAQSDARTPKAVRKAAVAGIGNLASSWGWEARGQLEASAPLRARAATRLIEVLATQAGDADIVTFAIQGIVSVDHPAAIESLSELAESPDAAVQAAARKAQTLLQIAQRRKHR